MGEVTSTFQYYTLPDNSWVWKTGEVVPRFVKNKMKKDMKREVAGCNCPRKHTDMSIRNPCGDVVNYFGYLQAKRECVGRLTFDISNLPNAEKVTLGFLVAIPTFAMFLPSWVPSWVFGFALVAAAILAVCTNKCGFN